jgi:hypothetical protein
MIDWKRALSLIALLLISNSASSLVNGVAPDKDDTRFDAVAAFSNTNWLIDNEEDTKAHTWFGAAVLIAPDVVLFAKHLVPTKKRDRLKSNAYMVRFRRHADGSLGSKRGGPNSYHQVPIAKIIFAKHADLAFGILAKPVKHIDPVKLYLENEPLEKTKCHLAGWGSESPWRGVVKPRTGLRVGTNTLSTQGMSFRLLSYKTETRENEEGKRASYVIDENAVPNMYDSGGSVFIEDKDGNLLLCGIIATYTAGNYLPAANAEHFPLEAAAKGARALVDARKEDQAKIQNNDKP